MNAGDRFNTLARDAEGVFLFERGPMIKPSALRALADAGRAAQLLARLDTKSRVTRAAFAAAGRTLLRATATGQPRRTNGHWPDYGRIHGVRVASEPPAG